MFTSSFHPLFSQKRRKEYGKPLRRMLMRYTGQTTLRGHGFPTLEMIPTGIIRQGDLEEQPIILWLLASLCAFKRQGIKSSTLIKLREITQRLDENPAQFLARLMEALQKYTKLDPFYLPVVSRYPKETKKGRRRPSNPSTRPFKFSL